LEVRSLAKPVRFAEVLPHIERDGPPIVRGAALPEVPRGWARIRVEIPAKTAVLLGLSVGICVPYFLLQQGTWFPLWTLPTTPLDTAIAFDPGWVYVYASVALLVPLLPLQATHREELVRYAKGLALMCGACFAIFLLFPVQGPRPIGFAGHETYQALISVDAALNSMPSLHAGLTLYSFLFGYRVLRDGLERVGRAAYVLCALVWTGAILYSTLATRQHWAVDLPAGVLLGWAGHAITWRAVLPAGRRAGSRLRLG